MPRLIIKGRDSSERVFTLDKDTIAIGKDDPESEIYNDINLDDKTASRRHAKITREEDDYFIEDLRSTNHTFVNGKEIKKAKLKHGDRITIGFSTLIFEAEGVKFLNPSDLVIKFQELDRSRSLDLNYFILHQISERLVSATNLEEFLNSILEMIRSSIKAEKTMLLLLGDDGEFYCRTSNSQDISYSKAAVERVRHEKRSMISAREMELTETLKTVMYQSIQSVMCAPILKYGEVIGIIYVEDPKPGKFGESDLVTLTTIANHISWNLDKVIRNENIKKEAVIRSNLERFLPFQLIDKITRESVSAGRINLKAEMVQAAILFSDIYGFTSLLEKLDPAEVIDLLTEYYKLMTDITFKYEGTLYKYDGSIIIAVFGAPVHNPNYAKNAVLAAIEMQEMQRQVKEQLEPKKKFDVKTGIAAGEIVTGSIKLPKSTEYTALGEAVIVANRLVALAESGNILVNKPINELVKADYITKFIGKMKAPKGDDKIEIYSVMSKIL